ncbi:MAG: RnfABCDGE type electron transport complex subunit B [Candidatus Marinimicrobia bacterium]|nr:RnfABCDGE type electron transport complex subunit B [Candidatus Neomarinimicrobiota bacterium]
MDIQSILIAAGSMGGLGLVFATVLAIANKKLHVEEDPRVIEIIDVLPGANCGGCGYPGCQAFADAVVKGDAPVGGCPVGGSDVADLVAKIMGVEVKTGEREVARCMCQGGLKEIAYQGEYRGAQSCIAATLVSGGKKLCEFGCMGLGDCAAICPFGAITISENRLPVVDNEKCVGCGKCVDVCPRDLMEMHPISYKDRVLCKNHDIGRYAMKICTRSCIACGLCEKKCPFDAIHVIDNLAVIDYEKCKHCGLCSTVCPNEAIEHIKKARKPKPAPVPAEEVEK